MGYIILVAIFELGCVIKDVLLDVYFTLNIKAVIFNIDCSYLSEM